MITRLPEYLLVTINRFYFDRETKKKEKICKQAEIPVCLNFQQDKVSVEF